MFATTFPDRVAGLVFCAPLVRILAEPGFPWAHDRGAFDAYLRYGEEHWGDGGVMGMHLASEPSTTAAPRFADAGEVLVSRTVVDQVAGSGLAFEDRGEHTLKGVPGIWRLFAVDV